MLNVKLVVTSIPIASTIMCCKSFPRLKESTYALVTLQPTSICNMILLKLQYYPKRNVAFWFFYVHQFCSALDHVVMLVTWERASDNVVARSQLT